LKHLLPEVKSSLIVLPSKWIERGWLVFFFLQRSERNQSVQHFIYVVAVFRILQMLMMHPADRFIMIFVVSNVIFSQNQHHKKDITYPKVIWKKPFQYSKIWWFQTFFIFHFIYGNVIIPTDELTLSYFSG